VESLRVLLVCLLLAGCCTCPTEDFPVVEPTESPDSVIERERERRERIFGVLSKTGDPS
jgi:hypothetical protein